jgi:hypothetical protein
MTKRHRTRKAKVLDRHRRISSGERRSPKINKRLMTGRKSSRRERRPSNSTSPRRPNVSRS